ncbi:hypothetical protein WOLCODRAFT_68900 [Wolfiporia cocos MD-104 SS10]|uniref:NYN domain-containing protein n=1 Tax=Wolfiporia cocos (strain MD-104) TaxID=742152 RepID=A0A2H3JDT8_WOLCO|nr:hypothetical protein WOLCODRAFT_68900 [Wolfiporia cocos MD-104 SS10]
MVENCPISTDAHRHIRALLTFAQRYGSIRTLRAYMDTSLYKSQMRSMLHQAGVSVVDCPHEDKKEVVDRAMGADLIEFALHRPAPATVILISGDCDHSPAISKLFMNGYTTIILSPQGALSRMSHAQTTMLLSWPELKPAVRGSS